MDEVNLNELKVRVTRDPIVLGIYITLWLLCVVNLWRFGFEHLDKVVLLLICANPWVDKKIFRTEVRVDPAINGQHLFSASRRASDGKVCLYKTNRMQRRIGVTIVALFLLPLLLGYHLPPGFMLGHPWYIIVPLIAVPLLMLALFVAVGIRQMRLSKARTNINQQSPN